MMWKSVVRSNRKGMNDSVGTGLEILHRLERCDMGSVCLLRGSSISRIASITVPAFEQ